MDKGRLILFMKEKVDKYENMLLKTITEFHIIPLNNDGNTLDLDNIKDGVEFVIIDTKKSNVKFFESLELLLYDLDGELPSNLIFSHLLKVQDDGNFTVTIEIYTKKR